jgi:hypothetical protein
MYEIKKLTIIQLYIVVSFCPLVSFIRFLLNKNYKRHEKMCCTRLFVAALFAIGESEKLKSS